MDPRTGDLTNRYLPLLPILMLRWHLSVGQVDLLALTTQALEPLLGAWADRRGGPWFIVGGLVIGSVGKCARFSLGADLRRLCEGADARRTGQRRLSSPYGGTGEPKLDEEPGPFPERLDGQRHDRA